MSIRSVTSLPNREQTTFLPANVLCENNSLLCTSLLSQYYEKGCVDITRPNIKHESTITLRLGISFLVPLVPLLCVRENISRKVRICLNCEHESFSCVPLFLCAFTILFSVNRCDVGDWKCTFWIHNATYELTDWFSKCRLHFSNQSSSPLRLDSCFMGK